MLHESALYVLCHHVRCRAEVVEVGGIFKFQFACNDALAFRGEGSGPTGKRIAIEDTDGLRGWVRASRLHILSSCGGE